MKLFSLFILILFSTHTCYASPKIVFWDTQRKGTNIFNKVVTLSDIKAAKKLGIQFIRLAPDKFKSKQRDFLIGNADNYQGLVAQDLDYLKKILDLCAAEKMPVVLTMLSLPGSRWKQNNHDKDDLRLWQSERFQQQAALFWQDLARVLKDHPAVVGYNLLNEPHPEKQDVARQVDTSAQLYDLYRSIITAIRKVDAHIPLILDSSMHADPHTFSTLKPHGDPDLLYAFHMYEPYAYTNHKTNQGLYTYPGKIDGKMWDKKALTAYINPVLLFQKKHRIPANRILVGEFGGNRQSKGLPSYFKDLISIFDENMWHYAFYAFREDTWDGMDYELGDKKLPGTYWVASEKGIPQKLNRNQNTPAFKILKESLDKK